jgi:biotin carboxyl carrier protein
MKLKATLAESPHDVSLSVTEAAVIADVDGRHYELELRERGRGEYLLFNGNEVHNVRVEQRGSSSSGSSTSFEVILRGRAYEVQIEDPKRLRSGQNSGAHHTGAAEIVSPMPGKIVRVLVSAGATVEAGTGVIVVEAMKMQNEMKAPKAGVIASINAVEGATVNSGDVLAVIE